MTKRGLHLLAYDVSEDGRLREALKIARTHATGGQLSVHECFLTAAEKNGVLRQYKELLDPATDRLLILRLDPRSRTYALGAARAPVDPGYFYVG